MTARQDSALTSDQMSWLHFTFLLPGDMVRRALPYVFAAFSVLLAAGTVTLRGEGASPLTPFQFLLGEWQAADDQAGATGGFTFAATVQDRVIVRTNHSDTPARDGKPASRHDDLMVIYADADVIRADYFDSEGHVIRYVAEMRPGEVVFLSEIKPAEPHYRLSYSRESATALTGKFEVAPPGKPDAFAPYLSWTAHKVK